MIITQIKFSYCQNCQKEIPRVENNLEVPSLSLYNEFQIVRLNICSCTFLYLKPTVHQSIYHLLWHRGPGSRHQIETKNRKKYDKYAANDLFDISNSWRIINIRKIDDHHSRNKQPVRFKRSIRTEMGSGRNCWLRLQADSCALTGWLRRRQGSVCVGISLIMTDTSLIRIGTNTQITLAINHHGRFHKNKGTF